MFSKKIEDVEYGRYCNSYKGTKKGYMPPEINILRKNENERKKYDGKKADIFSMGVMLYCMIFN